MSPGLTSRPSRAGVPAGIMGGMPSLESSIDRLYEGPLDQFVAERHALAKTVTGDEARQVKQLAKPTVVAWAVNQVYWRPGLFMTV